MATKNLYLLALAVWLLFSVTAATLRMVRMLVIAPVFGEQASYVIGSLLFIAAMPTTMWVFFSRINRPHRPFDLLLVGVLWTAMTVCSELGYFHYVPRIWNGSLAYYSAGRHWGLIVVLLMMLCGPLLIGLSLSSSHAEEITIAGRLMVTKNQEDKKTTSYSIIELVLGYLVIQAFVLMLVGALPWPIVGIESWGGHHFGRVIPDAVWALFWAQFAIGLLLPLRVKAFWLLGSSSGIIENFRSHVFGLRKRVNQPTPQDRSPNSQM
jgi:hypothetical protein